MSGDATTVTGRRRRVIVPTSFTDITDATVLDIAPAGDETAVTFGVVLTEEQIADVERRMESTDDTDQAKRADLRADRDALAEGDPLRRLYDYLLGE